MINIQDALWREYGSSDWTVWLVAVHFQGALVALPVAEDEGVPASGEVRAEPLATTPPRAHLPPLPLPCRSRRGLGELEALSGGGPAPGRGRAEDQEETPCPRRHFAESRSLPKEPPPPPCASISHWSGEDTWCG